MIVLLTGAAGHIGRTFFQARKNKYKFRLTDIKKLPYETDELDVQLGDLTDPSFATSVVAGVQAIIHLAGTPDLNSDFDTVLKLNVQPTKHLLTAAADQNVKRFIFASSAQTVEGYPVDVQVKNGDPIRPANYYGVGKIMGEALCALFACTHGLETISLRIGAFENPVQSNLKTTRDLSAWLSPRDATHLLDQALSASVNGPLILNGISNNRFKRLDIENSRIQIGYHPVDDAFARFDIPIDRLS